MQTFLIIHLLMLGALYTLQAAPFTSRSSNYQESFNDQFVLLIAYCLIVFNDEFMDKQNQYEIGWGICGLVMLDVLVNLGFIVAVSAPSIFRRIKYGFAVQRRRGCCKKQKTAEQGTIKSSERTTFIRHRSSQADPFDLESDQVRDPPQSHLVQLRHKSFKHNRMFSSGFQVQHANESAPLDRISEESKRDFSESDRSRVLDISPKTNREKKIAHQNDALFMAVKLQAKQSGED